MQNGKDAAGNESAQSTLTVTNIERTLPTVAYGTNGGSGASASTTVTISDLGGSNINISTLQYVWDTQNTVTPTSGWATFTNGATLTKAISGTYYLWIKASDNAGNTLVSKTNAFTIVIVSVSNFTYTGSIQTWTVPYTGSYKLETWGGQGGASNNNPSTNPGGQGAYAVSYVTLTQGNSIKILVASKGADGTNGGGGGGGTFIATSSNTPLAVAGGGGGNYYNYYIGNNGRYGQPTQLPVQSPSVASSPVAGQGGYTNSVNGGWSITAAGGGFYSNGANGIVSYSDSYGGIGFVNGGAGGPSSTSGGYGGGGGAAGTTGAGGGGYTGGSGGDGNSGNNYCGYGGGSYYTGTGSTAIGGWQSMPAPGGGTQTGQSGNGYAKITYIGS